MWALAILTETSPSADEGAHTVAPSKVAGRPHTGAPLLMKPVSLREIGHLQHRRDRLKLLREASGELVEPEWLCQKVDGAEAHDFLTESIRSVA